MSIIARWAWLILLGINALLAPLFAIMLLNAVLFQVEREIWWSIFYFVGLIAALILGSVGRRGPALAVAVATSALTLYVMSGII